MSDVVYPSFPGLKWNVKRTPMWKTLSQESVSGKELTVSLMTYPNRKYSISYEFLRRSEMEQIEGFFNQRRGKFDTFLYLDPEDNSVTDQVFGTGNGTTTSFPLSRVRGGFSEPVQALNGAPVIKVDGVTKATPADYVISTTGIVVFTTAPLAGQPITWTGNYYFRCRFLQDMAEFDQFLKTLWQWNRVEFRTVKI